jgi:glutaminyl-tRNA synthetase
MEVNEKALADKHLLEAKPFTSFQFERNGYYGIDPESKPGRLVVNMTVPLKEDASKNAE